MRDPFVATYAYVANRPTVLIDPSGLRAEENTCPSAFCWLKAGVAAGDLVDGGLQTVQTAAYGTYFAAYHALAHSEFLPPIVRCQLVGAEVGGLVGDAGIDLLRGNSIYNDARPDSVLPNYITDYWDPSWARTYLPGIGRDENGNPRVDFRW